MKTYRRHNCQRQHRTFTAMARCIWPHAEWISGDGPYALLAWCDVLTVTLHGTLADAEHWKRPIDGTGCGHACHGAHEIIKILLPVAKP